MDYGVCYRAEMKEMTTLYTTFSPHLVSFGVFTVFISRKSASAAHYVVIWWKCDVHTVW